MMQHKNILIVALPRHDENYSSTSWQLAQQFANKNQVFYIDHPFTLLDLVLKFRWKAVKSRIAGYKNSGWTIINGVKVIYSPFVIPVNFLTRGWLYNQLQKINHKILATRINKVFDELNIDSIVYWNSFEFYFPDLATHLEPEVEVKIYQCLDPMVKAITLRHGPELQQKLANSSDMIVSTSPYLVEQFNWHPRNYFVPNGANVKLFSTACTNTGLTEQYKTTGRVIGYLGNIERRTDFVLLQLVLERLPNWTLMMVGPYKPSEIPINFYEHPRVVFVGPVNQQEAPIYVNRFDVALIPFIEDEAGFGIYPLKMFEYLAAGKPVVSTNFNPAILQPLKAVIGIGSTANEFASEILKQYATDSDERIQERKAIAAENTWEHRAQAIDTLVSDYIKEHELNRYVNRK